MTLMAVYCYSINMEVISNLGRVMAEQQISLTDLAARVGITLANLSILKTNKDRAVRFSTLAKLCRELRCQPGVLLEFEKNDEPQPPAQTAPPPRRSDEG